MTEEQYGAAAEILSRDKVESKSQEWFDLRAKGITATDIAALSNNDPRGKSAFTVYWQKKLDLKTPVDAQMQAGSEWEPHVIELAYQQGKREYGNWTAIAKPGLLANRWYDDRNGTAETRPWMLCSPDALVYEDEYGWVPLEAKTSRYYEGWGEPGTDDIPLHYKCQAIWQAMVIGSDRAYVAALLPDHRIRIYVVRREENDWEWLAGLGADFMDTHLLPENPPMASGTAAEVSVLKRIHHIDPEQTATIPHDLISQWRHEKSMVSDYTKLAKATEARIREIMGDAKMGLDSEGNVVTVRRTVTRRAYSVEESTYEVMDLKNDRTKGSEQ